MEKVKKIFDKSIYVIEYIIALLLMINIFGIIADKAYNGYFPLNKIIPAAILGVAQIAIIVYICIKNKKVTEKLFVAFAIPLSIAFAIFILPLHVPDEGSHLLRAYDISVGNVFTQVDGEGNSQSTTIRELENYSYVRFQNYNDVRKELSKTTDYNDEVSVICAAQGSSPIIYVGITLAIIICRTFGINIFFAMYLGRLLNTIIFLVFGYLSIKKIPFGKILLALSLYMPMMLHQAGSCSSDAVLNAVLIYYITFLIHLVFKKEKPTTRENVELFILTALVAMFKYIYILVAGILFITVFTKKEERKEYLKTILIMILVGSIFAIGWFLFTARYKTIPSEVIEYNKKVNVDSARQVEFIMENPMTAIKTFANEYLVYGYEYVTGAIGAILGWLEIDVNPGVILAYLIILLIAAISEKSEYEFKGKSKIWILLLIFGISALLKGTMYIAFTPVGNGRICGVQGRYYTPLLFLAIMCLIKKNNNWEIKNLHEKMMVTSTILNICAVITVIQNYL